MSEPQTKITGGKISYGQTICPKQYESKRADVEVSFSVNENDDYQAIFDKSCNAAMQRVEEMLKLKPISKPAPAATKATETPVAAESAKPSTGLFE